MPHILIAGVVAAMPKSDHFPANNNRPRTELIIAVNDEVGGSWQYKVLAFGDLMDQADVLEPGDALSIQGNLYLELAKGKGGKEVVTGLYVVAHQLAALRKRSPNRSMAWAG